MIFSEEEVSTILVTGCKGLIGKALTKALSNAGYVVRGLDLKEDGASRGDIRLREDVDRAIDGCTGVVHLAAVSRVIDGERDPVSCWATNVEGTRNVLNSALAAPSSPWVIYASSREVYGRPSTLPVDEDAPRCPLNIYGRSKVAAEDLTSASGLQTAILRFSNVYGCTRDHADRVVPAFARQAAEGRTLRVDGSDHTFDFTHVEDTVRGILAVIKRLERGERLAPLHFLTGKATSLGQLASMAVEIAKSTSSIVEAPPRSYDVEMFYGDASRAAKLLDWRAEVTIEAGLSRLIHDFQAESSLLELV